MQSKRLSLKWWPILGLIVLSTFLILATGKSVVFSHALLQVTLVPRSYLPFLLRDLPLPLPPADQASSIINVPAGFALRQYASVSGTPRLMTIGPDGYLYVALYGSGQIVRLPDRNKDGLSDGVEVVASGLTSPHNLEWQPGGTGWLYVAELGKIEKLADNDHDGSYETRMLVTTNIPGAGGHTTRTLHFGPDGKLYVSAGSSCNQCAESDPRRAAILRFNPDGSIPAENPFAGDPDSRKQAVWAWGLRNSVDFLWTPSGQLWADMNGLDGLGDDVPPEAVVIPIQSNHFYGWPYCYTPVLGLNVPTQAQVANPNFPPPSGSTCPGAGPILFTVPAHSAPKGMSLGPAQGFPSGYSDDVFVALHGSWNTTSASFRDCKVQLIQVLNGQVTGDATFANGWRASGKPCGDAATYGRPAGVVFNSAGEMFISDDAGNRIYRVIYVEP